MTLTPAEQTERDRQSLTMILVIMALAVVIGVGLAVWLSGCSTKAAPADAGADAQPCIRHGRFRRPCAGPIVQPNQQP
jgi:hypothetical protein